MNLNQIGDQVCRELERQVNGTGIIVMFYDADYTDEKEGRTYERTYVKKIKDNLSTYIGIAREDDIAENRTEYEEYLRVRQRRNTGQALKSIPVLSHETVAACEKFDVYTTEELLSADPARLRPIGGVAIKEKVEQYLDKEERLKRLEELENERSNDNAEHSGRNATVRKTGNGSKQRKQGNKAKLKLPEEG